MRTPARMIRGVRLWALLAVLLLAAMPHALHAQTFPKLTGRVVDAANIIPADRKAALETKLADVEKQSGRQFVVATIPSLENYEIADYGYRLGRAWGLATSRRMTGCC